jgi:hypothetical protein
MIGCSNSLRESKKSTYDTLVTQERISTIDEYLAQRKELGKTLNDNSVLVRDKYGIFSKRVNRTTCITIGALNLQMHLLLQKAALPLKKVHVSRYLDSH